MTVYKESEEFAKIRSFSGIIFDCDGVLIDSSRSYDLALNVCSKAISSLLGLDFEGSEYLEFLGELRKLGTFNNDWDSLAVSTAYFYSKAENTKLLDELPQIPILSQRIANFEARVMSVKEEKKTEIPFEEVTKIVSGMREGTKRDLVCQAILRNDSLVDNLKEILSYPKPVGEGFLATLFDEVVYGKKVFREMYGFDCATTFMSDPGLILEEKKIIEETALVSFFSACGGNLGIITGRPRIPTLFTLGETFTKWFTRPEICLFTGDYLLDVDEVKPSPKPMLKVAKNLDLKDPVLYVGDSGEDLLMAKNVNKSGLLKATVYFVGIASSIEKARYFESEGAYADCIVSDVNELASTLGRNAAQTTRIRAGR